MYQFYHAWFPITVAKTSRRRQEMDKWPCFCGKPPLSPLLTLMPPSPTAAGLAATNNTKPTIATAGSTITKWLHSPRALGPCWTFAQAYLDNIVIGSPNWVTHIQHLQAVFCTLQNAKLQANTRKSRIGFL